MNLDLDHRVKFFFFHLSPSFIFICFFPSTSFLCFCLIVALLSWCVLCCFILLPHCIASLRCMLLCHVICSLHYFVVLLLYFVALPHDLALLPSRVAIIHCFEVPSFTPPTCCFVALLPWCLIGWYFPFLLQGVWSLKNLFIYFS